MFFRSSEVDNLNLNALKGHDSDLYCIPSVTEIVIVARLSSYLGTMIIYFYAIYRRHFAIDKCLQKITCDNIRFGKILRQIYTDGRSYLQCNERRV